MPNNSTLYYISFFYNLPSNCRCQIFPTQKTGFTLKINFYLDKKLRFHLYTNNNLSNNILILDENGYYLNWEKNDECYFIEFYEEPFGAKLFESIHPYIIIGKKFLKINNYQNSDFLSLFQNDIIRKAIKRHDRYLQSDFFTYLKENFKGSFKLYLTKYKYEKLLNINDDNYLFGLTWIFTWAISSIATESFSCFMTDTTFKSIKPYSLTLILIIISNESLPIGLAIFPTETALL